MHLNIQKFKKCTLLALHVGNIQRLFM